MVTSDGDLDSVVKKKSASKGKGMKQRKGQGKEAMRVCIYQKTFNMLVFRNIYSKAGKPMVKT